jgi:hypothetical protein
MWYPQNVKILTDIDGHIRAGRTIFLGHLNNFIPLNL